jgi:uncharacterized protein DUF732
MHTLLGSVDPVEVNRYRRWRRRRSGNAARSADDGQVMMRNCRTTVATLAMTAALIGGAATVAAPAHADPVGDTFVSELTDAGVTGIDPATAIVVGQAVCPQLVEPGQNVANVAAGVADAIGRPLGPATMFTGVAISMFCPAAVQQLASGEMPAFFSLFDR